MKTWPLSIIALALLLSQTSVGQSKSGSKPPVIRTSSGSQASYATYYVKRGIPGSFLFDGKKSADLLPKWQEKTSTSLIDDVRVRNIWTYLDPKTGLEVKDERISYLETGVEEWTLYLKNAGKKDTPIIEDLQAIDEWMMPPGLKEYVLHHNVGSPASKNDYGPLETPLGPGAVKRISAAGGRPTNSDMSYFNLSYKGGGTILVVGWPGQWNAEFRRDSKDGLHIRAGQELTHFRLHPGEEVRTPLIVTLPYKGDWIDGQNQWRHWMMAYGMPKPGGHLPKPMMLASSGRAYGEMIGANEANQIMHIDRYLEEKLNIDYWWMDAGWYIQQNGWPQVGTWEVDPKRFPKGFTPVSDHAHSRGVKTLVWFEPERVAPDTWLSKNHPEWLLSPFGSLETHRSKSLGTGEPCVVYNTGEKTVRWNGITWKPRALSFHPGPKGEYGVVRYIAPMGGDYRINADFAGIDEKTTTDVHVLRRSESLFDSLINLEGHGRDAHFSGSSHLQKGESMDFVVGFGNGNYGYDSTGVDVTITDPNGVEHDAAKEYKKSNWSYGYLPPSTKPDPSAFKAFDKVARNGADGTQLLNLGNPVAWKWLVEHVDKLLTDNHIDLYRQDFNMDPLEFWRGNDAEDRQGITEIKHVMGYLAYWDELRRRHPNMLIDSCASGGRRNDLETMRRSVPLWRSDYAYEPIGHQGMTYGISMWLPFHGTATVATTDAPYYGGGVTPVQPYAFWSNTAPSLGSGIDIREKKIDYDELRHLFGEWRGISQYYYSDFYPLTPYSLAGDVWIGWQFNRPEKGDGLIELFRRQNAASLTFNAKLRELDPRKDYRIVLVDAAGNETLVGKKWTGKELMENGVPVTLSIQPSAAILTYHQVKD